MKLITTYAALFAVTTAFAQGPIVIPDGTKVRVRLEQTLSSKTADEGQTVELSAVDRVVVNGMTAIPEGASVTGTITNARQSQRMGRAGKLDFSIDRVKAADGRWIPVRYVLQKRQGDSKALSTGIITAGVALVFWPAAPFLLLRKGKDTDIHRGVVFDVYTDRNHPLGGEPQPPVTSQIPENNGGALKSVVETSFVPLNPTSASALATISISCPQQGAEIEIDGAFAGSTPSVLKLSPGRRTIRVRHGQEVWERVLNLQAESHVSLVPILGATGR